MKPNSNWKEGDVIVFRGLGFHKIWYALPAIVVNHSADLVALFWRSGTHGKGRVKPSFENVTPVDVLSTPMDLLDRTWLDTDILMLMTPGLAHAVYIMWANSQRNYDASMLIFRS